MKQKILAHFPSWAQAYAAYPFPAPGAIYKRTVVDGQPRIAYVISMPDDEEDCPVSDYCRCSNPDCDYKPQPGLQK